MEFQEFKLSQMVSTPSILIIGKRDSDKSYIIRDIMHEFKNIPCRILFPPRDRMCSFKDFFPDLCIHHNLNDHVLLKKILARQSIMIEKAITAKKTGAQVVDPSCIIVMDDCIHEKKPMEDLLKILMNGRFYHITSVVTSQFPRKITPDISLNFDYVFLLKDNSSINKKKLWLNYASMFSSLESFEKVFNQLTQNGCMVIDNRKICDNIEDKFFSFKASESPSDKIFEDFVESNKIENKSTRLDDSLLSSITIESDSDSLDDIIECFNTDNHSENSHSENSHTQNAMRTTNCKHHESLNLSYNDDTYHLCAHITDLHNHELIKILCDHIISLKK